MNEYEEVDFKVIEAVLNGNTASFKKIIERYEAMVFDLAYKHLQNYEDAKDLTQEIFLKIFNQLDKYDSNYKFFSWLYRISLNEIYSYLKKTKWKKKIISIEKVKSFLFSDLKVYEEKSDLLYEIQKIISKVSERDREIFNMYYFDDYSVEKIAKISEESKSNVKVILHRLREKIKDKLNVEVEK